MGRSFLRALSATVQGGYEATRPHTVCAIITAASSCGVSGAQRGDNEVTILAQANLLMHNCTFGSIISRKTPFAMDTPLIIEVVDASQHHIAALGVNLSAGKDLSTDRIAHPSLPVLVRGLVFGRFCRLCQGW